MTRILIVFFCISLQSSTLQSEIIGSNDNGHNFQEQVPEVKEAAHVGPSEYVSDEIIVKFRERVSGNVEEQLEFEGSANVLKLSRGLDELNARHRAKEIRPLFKNFKNKRQQVEVLLRKDKALLTKREKHIIRRLKRARKGVKVPDLSRTYKLKVELEPGQSLKEVAKAYDNDPDVEYAELNYIVSIHKTPNDPFYDFQWPLHNTEQIYPESGKCGPAPGMADCDIDAPEAWDINTGSTEVIIAVVDTGVDYNHRDLQSNMWTDLDGYYGYDFVNDDNDPIDDKGHGTHCAGIIAAEGDNGLDIAGVCWDGRIMAVKFLDEYGYGTDENAAEAIYYAVNNGADVISNSWGSEEYSETLEEAIAYAYSQGVVVVAAAGNKNTTSPSFPAHYDHVISVAATDSDDERAYCSSSCGCGWASNYGNLVDIAAPGVDVLSLRASGTSLGTPYDSYTTIASGTSMACPHVAGACGLMLSRYSEIQVDELEQHLLESADPISPEICASGRLNVYEALARIPGSRGLVFLDKDYYNCSGLIEVKLLDLDLKANGAHPVTVSADGGDSETVLLSETIPAIGVFTGTIWTSSGDPNAEDGTLQVSDGEIITATYNDANDGTGSPAIVEDTALIDCQVPVIFNVQVETWGVVARVTFETDEPTTGSVRCGLECGGPYIFTGDDLAFATVHTIQLNDLPNETTLYFVVDACDAADNEATDDNGGLCYSFTTTTPIVLYVPTVEFPTIQAAIDEAWGGWGETVVVAEGVYYENINFDGKDITLRSTNPDDPNVVATTIIDGGDLDSVVTFGGTESSDCVLTGFTIRNGQRGKPLYVDIQAQNGDVEPGWVEWSAPSGQEPGTIALKAYFDDDFSAYMDWGQCLDNGDWQTDYPPAPLLADVLEDGYKEDECCAALIFSDLEAGDYEILTYHCDMMHPGPDPKTTFDIEIEGEIIVDDAEVVGNYISNPELDAVYFEFSSDGIHEVEIWFDYYGLAEEFWLNGFVLRLLEPAWEGGGVRGNGCSATITKCVITDNQATYGGGLHDCDGLIQDNIICDNHVSRINLWGMGGNYDGGGLHDCDGVIERNIITGNSAWSGAGLCRCDGTIRCNIILDNNGMYGGAAAICNGSIINNLVTGNLGVMGGAIAACNGIISNCTIVGNKWRGLGDCYGTISNCIVWENDSEVQLGDCSVPTYSCIENWAGGGISNISTNPCFVSIEGYWEMGWIDINADYRLQWQSLCINTGDPNYTPAPGEIDIDGQDRVMQGRVDMGVYEFNPQRALIKSPAEIQFYANEGGTDPNNQVISITNCGGGVLNWSISYDCEWLEVEPTNGVSTGEPNEVTISVDISALGRGDYNCQLTILDPNAVNNPRMMSVNLHVFAPVIELSASEFEFFADMGGENPADQNFTISNSGGGTLNWQITESCDWLSVYPDSGNSAGEPNNVMLSVDISGLVMSQYNCEVTISDPNAENNPQLVQVQLNLYAGDELYVPAEFATIQAAINVSNDGATVIVAEGVYTGAGNRNLDFGNGLPEGQTRAITVRSTEPNDPDVVAATVIECEAGGRGFNFHTGEGHNSVVAGFTIINGYEDYGGGIHCDDASPTITNCTITGNTAQYNGGGLYCGDYALPIVSNCIIVANTANENGGGIGCDWDSDPNITNSIITGNIAHNRGGAVACEMSSPRITNCLIADNSADDAGGGIYCHRWDEPVVSNCTFVSNSALNGNALACDSFNQNFSSEPQLINCILWNGADEIWNNDGSTITITYSDVQGGWPGTGNIDIEPNFVSGPLGDYYLSQIAAGKTSNSPCVDAGSNTALSLGLDVYTTRTDQVTDAGIVDMGFHYVPLSETNIADINKNWLVGLDDLLIMALQWLQIPSTPSADIAPDEPDNFVDYLDFSVIGQNWRWPEQ